MNWSNVNEVKTFENDLRMAHDSHQYIVIMQYNDVKIRVWKYI